MRSRWRLLAGAVAVAAVLPVAGASILRTPAGDAVVASPGAAAPRQVCDAYASPLGDDRREATRTAPVRTVARLVALLPAGATGCLRTGRYDGRIEISRDGVTLRSAPDDRATLTGAQILVNRAAEGVTISHLDVVGAADAITLHLVGSDFTVEHNDITNKRQGTSCVLVGASDFRTGGGAIRENVIHGCGRTGDHLHHGIYAQNSGPAPGSADGLLIEGNVLYDTASYAVQLYPRTERTVVRRNLIDGGGRSIRGGIVLDGEQATGHLIEGNVIGRTRSGAVIQRVGSGNRSRGNCLWENAAGILGGIDSRDERTSQCWLLRQVWVDKGERTACRSRHHQQLCSLLVPRREAGR